MYPLKVWASSPFTAKSSEKAVVTPHNQGVGIPTGTAVSTTFSEMPV